MSQVARLDPIATPPADDESAAFARAFGDLLTDFLLLIVAHLPPDTTKKGAAVRKAYRRVVNGHFRQLIDDRHRPLAVGSRGVALQLHAVILDLCRSLGVESLDLIEQLNAANQAHASERTPDTTTKLKALLAILLGDDLAEVAP